MANQSKTIWPGGTQLAPVPVVLVGCGDGKNFKYNCLTVAWAGTLSSNPPMVGIGIRPERYSRGLIESSGVFTVNMPTAAMAEKVDYCGVVSGRDVDKFAKCGFTAAAGSKVDAPIITECPISLECKVKHSLSLGSHILYIGEVLAVQISSEFIDGKNHFDVEKADLLAYAHGNYMSLGKSLGTFGYSVKKK
ncbi:MAG: flavin reductase family protein [Lentisphaerae bacterium]|nr:flavin reductase family protein [Lentisphaerota bacterium]